MSFGPNLAPSLPPPSPWPFWPSPPPHLPSLWCRCGHYTGHQAPSAELGGVKDQSKPHCLVFNSEISGSTESFSLTLAHRGKMAALLSNKTSVLFQASGASCDWNGCCTCMGFLWMVVLSPTPALRMVHPPAPDCGSAGLKFTQRQTQPSVLHNGVMRLAEHASQRVVLRSSAAPYYAQRKFLLLRTCTCAFVLFSNGRTRTKV